MAKTVKKSKQTRVTKSAKTTELKVQKTNALPGGQLNNFLNSFPSKIKAFRTSKTFYLIVLALGLALLVMIKKSWFVAALVNGAPVTNLELQSKLNDQFRTQTLNQLINEKIIMSEAQKNGTIPTEQEVDAKIAELETSVGGKDTLDSLLTQQSQTRSQLRDQIRVQLAITKLYSKEATVSSEEIAKFIEENRENLKATDSAQQEKEAEETIKNQKLSQLFSQKFQDLRQKAKIQIF
jgi:hypothetical protein